eukprot:jgi/Chlat1/5086/Chrsp33S05017
MGQNEASGAAAFTPNDIGPIFNLLQQALNQDQRVRQPASEALASCEDRAGFCSCLLEIVSHASTSSDESARWLAAVHLKNCVIRHWRMRRDGSGIGEGEKAHLRSKLLDVLGDRNSQIAVQLAIVAAKIARFDFPRDWPQLFPTLLSKLQSPDVLLTTRIYLALHHILKELASKRLMADQRHFAQIALQLFDLVWSHWCADTQRVVSALPAISQASMESIPNDEAAALLLACERWLLALKALRRLLLFGYGQADGQAVQLMGRLSAMAAASIPQDVPQVAVTVPVLLQALQSLLPYWRSMQQSQHALRWVTERGSLKVMKTMIDIQLTHPSSFRHQAVMLPVLDFCYNQMCSAEDIGGPAVFERLLIQCMVFIQNVVKCPIYRPGTEGPGLYGDVGPAGRTPEMEQQKRLIASDGKSTVDAFLNQDRLISLCIILVERYFTLSVADLEEWAQHPEGFHQEQDITHWKDRLRPCAEACFLVLMEKHREVLAPVTTSHLQQAVAACPPSQSDDAHTSGHISAEMLRKEAWYNAAGIASSDLADVIDFEAWYKSSLALELANRQPNGRILRRRVAWLLGCWVSKITESIRQSVYASLVNLIAEDDAVVQLAAVASLRAVIDDWHFYEQSFLPYVETCLAYLFRMLHTTTEFDSQLQVFNLVSLIVERLADKISPYAEKILAAIPDVWRESEGQSLLRIQVITALQRVVSSLGTQSPMAYPVLMPILQHSTDVNQPDELNLLEDGMQLWQVTLRQASSLTADLMALFPHLPAAIERSFEHLQVAMRILESYILLGRSEFLNQHAHGVVNILVHVVGNVKDKGMVLTLPIIDTLVQCFPQQSPPLLEPVLHKLLKMVLDGSQSEVVAAAICSVLARVLLQNAGFFMQFIQSHAASVTTQDGKLLTAQTLLFQFLSTSLEKMDSMTTTAKRKLCALALCVLLPTPDAQILEYLDLLLSACTSVLCEVEGDRPNMQNGYDYWVTRVDTDETDANPAESEVARRRQLFNSDPINNLRLGAVLKEKLSACASVHGEAFQAAMSRVDPAILGQLQQFVGS